MIEKLFTAGFQVPPREDLLRKILICSSFIRAHQDPQRANEATADMYLRQEQVKSVNVEKYTVSF